MREVNGYRCEGCGFIFEDESCISECEDCGNEICYDCSIRTTFCEECVDFDDDDECNDNDGVSW